ncbi:MAG TPA: histidine phosphatase family protein [Chloroflexia bacterium]
MRIYFVRHGESDANTLNVFSNRAPGHALTASGRKQVALLADELTREPDGNSFLAIYSSPLQRAIESAQILSEKLAIPYVVSAALTEYDVGIYEGRSDEEGWRKYGEVLREWLLDGNWDARMEGGESFNDMRSRFLPFMEWLKSQHGHRDGSVILMGHGGTYGCMLPLVLENVDFAFAAKNMIENTTYILADLKGGKFVCSTWGGIQVDRADG